MPEGHTLHRLAATIADRFGGRRVASSSPQGRFADGAARVDGHVVAGAEAWGKHLLVEVDGLAERVHVHLGLWGSMAVLDGGGRPVVGQVRWRVEHAGATADLRGPTTCELLAPPGVEALLSRLGPDPLRPDARPAAAWARVRSSRAPLAVMLMDQSLVAGVGNVYRAEVLFRQRIAPTTRGRDLDEGAWWAVWDDLVSLMGAGVRTGRIDTVRPEHEPAAMGRAPRQDDHGGEVYVYRREGLPCLVCDTPVMRAALAGRNVFWCPVCQRDR